MDATLLADVGGSYLRYRIGGEEVVRSGSQGWDGQLNAILEAHPAIRRLGIAFAGQVSGDEILSAPNLARPPRHFVQTLRERFPLLQVAIENDLKCAALAYRRHLGSDSVAVLYSGSGLGSAVVEGGKIVRGCRNLAGEIGHVSYKNAPFRCGCGKSDCLELFASGSGFEKHRRHRGFSDQIPDRWLEGGSAGEISCAEEAAEALAYAASLLITLYNPEHLVIGGGVWEHNPLLRQRARAMIPVKTFPPAMRECSIVDADLPDAPLIGAGLLFGDDFWLQ